MVVGTIIVCLAELAAAQTAGLTGYVRDQQGAVMPGVSVVVTSDRTGFTAEAMTDAQGLYVVPQLPPGAYSIVVEHPGFHRLLRAGLALDAAAVRRVDMVLTVGALTDTVQVSGGRDLLRETVGLGTLIKPDEMEHLPVNGRSVQKLISLAAGVVSTSGTSGVGEFSAHGQRSSANYLTIDGVGGNISTEAVPLAGYTAWGNGTLPGFSTTGSSSNLFSLDAVEEIRIQTSSYAPEYGRMPGAQISVVTKSGSNAFRGSGYEYFRDEGLDATDPFVKARGLAKPAMRFHVFGATLGGPVPVGGPAFFFGNFEGQRLTLPRFRTTGVPTQAVRDRTSGALRQLVDAWPLPNGPDLAPGVGEFSAAFADTSDANSGAVRVDYAPGVWRMFGRLSVGDYHSKALASSTSTALSQLLHGTGRTTTVTVGANLVLGKQWFVESRLNYSRNRFASYPGFNALNGAQAVAPELIFPPGATVPAASLTVTTGNAGSTMALGAGNGATAQRQVNGIVSVTTVRRGHTVKMGGDVRQLAPEAEIPSVRASYSLGNVATLAGDRVSRVTVLRTEPGEVTLWNLSAFAQDQWQMNERLLVTYGVRWDVNPAPQLVGERRPYLVEFPEDPSRTRQRASTKAFWATDYRGVAPRAAVSYRLSRSRPQDHIVRASAGLFYDVGWGSSLTALGVGFPFRATRTLTDVELPLPASMIPDLPSAGDAPGATDVYAFPEHPSLPRTTQWNVGYEFAQRGRVSASVTYLASRGTSQTRLVLYDYTRLPAAPYVRINALDTNGRSAYDALELSVRVRPSSLLEGDISYTLGRSRDNVSEDVSVARPSGDEDPDAGWGPSDYDARHLLNWRTGLTFPGEGWRLLNGISLYVSGQFRSALPITPVYLREIGFGRYLLRPDRVVGEPLYLEGDYPGGRRVNPAAFQQPLEARQGTAERNLVRGFSLSQIDLSVKKRVRVWRAQVDVGVDVFNIFNRTQFDRPLLEVGASQFGLATQTAANGLGSGTNGRGLSPLFQLGGPRSIQLVFRTAF